MACLICAVLAAQSVATSSLTPSACLTLPLGVGGLHVAHGRGVQLFDPL